jgi:hypothetical protein
VSSTALRGRRLAVVAVTTIAVGALGAVLSTPASTASAETVAPTAASVGAVAAAGLVPVVTVPLAVPATRSVPASRSVLRPAVIVPYRYGTTAYSKWWARSYMASHFGWKTGRQFVCLVRLWTRESHWNLKAHNHRSGAHGIPQALPGKKMAKFGRDWRTNPRTQIKWGLSYIHSHYGSPCAAWSHWTRRGWY